MERKQTWKKSRKNRDELEDRQALLSSINRKCENEVDLKAQKSSEIGLPKAKKKKEKSDNIQLFCKLTSSEKETTNFKISFK